VLLFNNNNSLEILHLLNKDDIFAVGSYSALDVARGCAKRQLALFGNFLYECEKANLGH
jgi:hypothetical protein